VASEGVVTAEGSTGAPLCDVHLSKYGRWVCVRCGYEPVVGDSATWQFVSVIPAREANADV
jgi:predicted nucleic-acid-binding Zn-ribbon protein